MSTTSPRPLGENLCLARSGGRAAVARLSNLFDAADEAGGFLSDLLKRARRERAITLDSSPQAGRDYIHVDDVIAALLAMDAKGADGIVNIARGEALSNAEVARVFAEAGWRLELTGPPSEPHGPTCDTGRLAALGVQPRDAREVLREILARPDFFQG
jgi:nucleoside-diphosphate-sugar epimerase